MYLRATSKLSNKNTRGVRMECFHLLCEASKKVCRQMLERGLDGELDDFDVAHYCKGNPNYCFFFRFGNTRSHVIEESEAFEADLSVIPVSSMVTNEPIQTDGSSSKQPDKLIKLKRLLHRIV